MTNEIKTEVPDGYVLLERRDGKAIHAACMDGGRFHGWLFTKGPENDQWVSQRKLEPWEIMQVEDQRDDNIVHDTESQQDQTDGGKGGA